MNGREKENEGTFVKKKTTERLAKTGANESDDTHLPYKISARDFRQARLSHLCFLFRSGPVVSLWALVI